MQLGNGISFDNTKSVRDDARYIKLPPTPAGRERLDYEIGETVVSTGLGTYKAGYEVKIADRYMQNGFAYYRDTTNIVHRAKDIKRRVS